MTLPGDQAPATLAERWLDLMGLVLETAAGAERTFGRRLEETSGLSMQWFEILLRLERTPGNRLRMSDLAGQSTLSLSGLTRCVDRLEEAGLVQREACDTDRRVAYATLTPAGHDRIAAALGVHLSHLDEVLGPLTDPDELDRLDTALHRLRAAINPEAAEASTCPESVPGPGAGSAPAALGSGRTASRPLRPPATRRAP